MLITVAETLTAIIGVLVVLMGVNGLLRPQAASGFGIPGTPTDDRTFQAWLAVKAARDIGLGLIILILVAGAAPHLLGWSLLAAAGIPVGDTLIVLRSGGPKATAYGVHAATAAVMAAISLLLLLG
ncbi:membrane protein [Actinoplanes lobatus]|uniref:Membrane protein n=1 Tax=Actinoplanes lobatus TaxID=113568 RepID=A0A7W7HNM1_9ACTN|nr:DUF4267 domain-containing protein [Actinoplanes lobatus]MBB4753835.1 hypothetical protein [Actinoplanes lobatus]GGN72328.1 membrane protein [Actinoplanes lobatus]GIE42011.1 membrane protein [Actinoplanes lobatus]